MDPDKVATSKLAKSIKRQQQLLHVMIRDSAQPATSKVPLHGKYLLSLIEEFQSRSVEYRKVPLDRSADDHEYEEELNDSVVNPNRVVLPLIHKSPAFELPKPKKILKKNEFLFERHIMKEYGDIQEQRDEYADQRRPPMPDPMEIPLPIRSRPISRASSVNRDSRPQSNRTINREHDFGPPQLMNPNSRQKSYSGRSILLERDLFDDKNERRSPRDISDVIDAHAGKLPNDHRPAPDTSIKVDLADGTSIMMTKNEYLAYRLGLANKPVRKSIEAQQIELLPPKIAVDKPNSKKSIRFTLSNRPHKPKKKPPPSIPAKSSNYTPESSEDRMVSTPHYYMPPQQDKSEEEPNLSSRNHKPEIDEDSNYQNFKADPVKEVHFEEEFPPKETPSSSQKLLRKKKPKPILKRQKLPPIEEDSLNEPLEQEEEPFSNPFEDGKTIPNMLLISDGDQGSRNTETIRIVQEEKKPEPLQSFPSVGDEAVRMVQVAKISLEEIRVENNLAIVEGDNGSRTMEIAKFVKEVVEGDQGSRTIEHSKFINEVVPQNNLNVEGDQGQRIVVISKIEKEQLADPPKSKKKMITETEIAGEDVGRASVGNSKNPERNLSMNSPNESQDDKNKVKKQAPVIDGTESVSIISKMSMPQETINKNSNLQQPKEEKLTIGDLDEDLAVANPDEEIISKPQEVNPTIKSKGRAVANHNSTTPSDPNEEKQSTIPKTGTPKKQDEKVETPKIMKIAPSNLAKPNHISISPQGLIPPEDKSEKGKLVKDLSGQIKPPPNKIMAKNKSRAIQKDRQIDYPSPKIVSPAIIIPSKKDMPAIDSVSPSAQFAEISSFQKAYLRKAKRIEGLEIKCKLECGKFISKQRMKKLRRLFRRFSIATAYYAILKKKLSLVIEKRYSHCQEYYRTDLEDTIRVGFID